MPCQVIGKPGVNFFADQRIVEQRRVDGACAGDQKFQRVVRGRDDGQAVTARLNAAPGIFPDVGLIRRQFRDDGLGRRAIVSAQRWLVLLPSKPGR